MSGTSTSPAAEEAAKLALSLFSAGESPTVATPKGRKRSVVEAKEKPSPVAVEKETTPKPVEVVTIDEDEEEPEEAEAYYRCSVDSCRLNTPLSQLEFLPKDNVLEGVQMILACKTVLHEQNTLLQRYLEAHYLARRPNSRTAKEWSRRLPFRVCSRHFDENNRLTRLPRQLEPVWKNLVELLHRESLFHMYGVKRAVEYPAGNTAGEALAKLDAIHTICAIPACGSNPVMVDQSTRANVRLYPVPFETEIRRQWQEAIEGSLGVVFSLPATGYICEKHFPNWGRIVNGRMELPTLFDRFIRDHFANEGASVDEARDNSLQLAVEPAARTIGSDIPIKHCLVRCCPITSNTWKSEEEPYEMFPLPEGSLGDQWVNALREADAKFFIKFMDGFYVCERHFVIGPNVARTEIPSLFLTPSDATPIRSTMRRVDMDNPFKEDACPCCRDVEICHDILRRFNGKMNTLMQHVNMLCVLEGVKEVIPRPFDDTEDDTELYGDPEKVAALAGVRAASMFVAEAKSELAAINKALNTMAPPPRRTCSIFSCGSTKRLSMLDLKTFEKDIKSGELLIRSNIDVASIRKMFVRSNQPVAICDKHYAGHITNMSIEFEEDNEEVKKLKEALAIPLAFQPKFKRRKVDGEETEEAEGEGGSGLVQVEVKDDEEEDERLLSNNELLQRLLGGAIPGQVTGEIGDNGEVYEGGEEEAEMDQLDNQEPGTEEEREEEGEGEEDEDSHEEPPALH